MNSNSEERWILYSTCDEDSFSELRALAITPEDDLLSVTGSGCRTLSLLTSNPRRLASVDRSSGQNYLLELKLAAIRALSYDSLLEFFGVDPCAQRWRIFTSLENRISPQAGAYFRRHKEAIERGILFSGRHEMFYVKYVAPVMHLLFGRALKKIYQVHSVEEQAVIYRKHLDGWLWRWMIRRGFSERMLRRVFNDADYRFEVDVPSIPSYMLERLEHTFTHHLARKNHWVSFMLNGKYPSREVLPHFLLRDSYEAIRRAKTDLRIVTEGLYEYLQCQPSDSIEKFSLSDVTSCVTRVEFDALLKQVVRTGRPAARVCYRNFLAKYSASANPAMQRDDSLCDELNRDDLAFAYTFEVATIEKHAMAAGSAATSIGQTVK